MPGTTANKDGHRRASSSSTLRAAASVTTPAAGNEPRTLALPITATLWVHDDTFSTEEILINPSILTGNQISEGTLLEIVPLGNSTDVLDFEDVGSDSNDRRNPKPEQRDADTTGEMTCLCIAKFGHGDILAKHSGLEVSLTKTIAEAFKLHSRMQVALKPATFERWTASHIELSFRDAYLARSDMWRLVSLELANKVVYRGQKISFLGTMKLTIKEVHVNGRRMSKGYFAGTTIPVFRSEAARYVLFIQMSREMWDFDSEGRGEIMFNRVVNGFLPDLFRRWVQLEVRHLVSIVLFGRMEYDRYDLVGSSPGPGADRFSRSPATSNPSSKLHQDFFRVVVTDMASAQWTTILNELKKDFRVFLRDISLHEPPSLPSDRDTNSMNPKITGRPSTALKGNILEAINMASSQFANDYIDRDLIRTGVSTVIITAGSGVFDVDRDLLNLTSENLTNNGIGIDIVCLSKMPLHSVPLFRYRLPPHLALSRADSNLSNDSHSHRNSLVHPAIHLDESSALSSFTGTSVNYFARFPSAFPMKHQQHFGYGIPHWIDLSYWAPSSDNMPRRSRKRNGKSQGYAGFDTRQFLPRVRMYELQMMGLMELGMADISIPYISETKLRKKRARHRKSADLSYLSLTRSLSQSPSYFRKSSAMMLRQRDSLGALSQDTNNSTANVEAMDEYDDLVFVNVGRPRNEPRPRQKKLRPRTPQVEISPRNSSHNRASQDVVSEKDFMSPTKTSPWLLMKSSQNEKVGGEPKPRLKAKQPRISRSISYALRGLSAPLKSSAISETSADNVKALPAAATTSLTLANATTSSTTRAESIRSMETREADTQSTLSGDSVSEHPSKPILISGTNPRPVSQQISHKLEKAVRAKGQDNKNEDKRTAAWLNSPPRGSDDEMIKEFDGIDNLPNSVPKSTLPFIQNVNASNPLKRHLKDEYSFGRWQHLYPHKPRASLVKWRSLCTPASVPLTTQDFPTAHELANEYIAREHVVQMRHSSEILEVPATVDDLLFEMVVLRLSHGYQIVVGETVRQVIGNALCETSVFLNPTRLTEHGNSVLMSMGNTIQMLSFSTMERINVTKYVKRQPDDEDPSCSLYTYNPNIRTILQPNYWSRVMELRGFSEEYPWEVADTYLADGEVDSSSKVNRLRFWRARFVLLPVEPPSSTWRSYQSNEDTEEEIHLLGIRALTQMWQKARYIHPSERKIGPGRMDATRRQDQNPLEIKFETLNPSELVATELDKMLALEEAGEVASTQLLPDSEKLDRDTSMARIAQAMQGERGIEIKNRRWHLRLHYNCFSGEEFTNWLLSNVKGMQNRDDVVEFGNSLMKEGLFEHVNGRHRFRDGNFFYSLKQEFKVPRIDVKGSWFPGVRRFDRSVPPTPASEPPPKEVPPMATRSRSGSSLAYSLISTTPLETSKTFLDKRKKTVTLTKKIKVDVDPRKRSGRSEIVDLHYDRFHNPENCYHLELSWLNTTSKLVDDAIVSWTNQAERYGLKLVEVPIAEASRIPDAEPFRKAYRIKLALEPPKKQVVSHVLTSSSFTPQPNSNVERNVYQKAILKQFNFVLDLEGTAEFPDNVDVQFSSTGLEYKHTQFVHRSGVCLAQITDEGDFLLLANRLYNARFANSKEAANAKFDHRKELNVHSGFPVRTPMQSSANIPLQASGIVGLNLQSPRLSSLASPSPMSRATADVFGSRSALSTSSVAQYVTPEQVKDELEQFCHDATKLELFYRDYANDTSLSQPASGPLKKSTGGGGGTSSSVLKPISDANEGIPEFVLPEAVASPSISSSGFGLGFSSLMSRRARASVAYESVAEMFNRCGGGAGADRSESPRNGVDGVGKEHSTDVSGRTSGEVSGHLELKVRVDTPSSGVGDNWQRIDEDSAEGTGESIGSPKPEPRSGG